ncbi:MAG: diguanylate cyclase [Azospirillaceae bacterium]|nr:diguanylate cyclase [Azospirillaceae bacterium]
MPKLVFANKKTKVPPPNDDDGGTPWKVLIVDDDAEVHAVTRLALRNLKFHNRTLEFLHAHSGKDAVALIEQHRDIALILLDVVMETDDAGLRLVEHIRGELRNHNVRIVLRTGQPGQAPETEVIHRYDINDYKAKTELTQQKLCTTVVTALRGYRDLVAIETSRKGLRKIIEASASLMQSGSMKKFASGVLTQLGGLLGTSNSGILCTQATPGSIGDLAILAASGRFENLEDATGDKLDTLVRERIAGAVRSGTTICEPGYTTLHMRALDDRDVLIYVEAERPLNDVDRSLVEVFGANIAVCFKNLEMFEQTLRDNERLEQRVAERTRDLHEREERQRAILEGSPVGAAILRLSDGAQLFANSRLCHLLQEFAGPTDAPLLDILLADPTEGERIRAAIAGQGEVSDAEIQIARPGGGTFWALLTARPITINGEAAVLVWLYDITLRKLLEQELMRQATQDYLTGIPNRRRFLELAEQELRRTQRYQHPMSVLMIDIDRFKNINDTFGHQVGDEAIRVISDTCVKTLRALDIFGRMGGEEFAAILPETPEEQAVLVAERIRQAVASVALPLESGTVLHFTVSIGVAAPHEAEALIDPALARADSALYDSKYGGRNRVSRFTMVRPSGLDGKHSDL